jgi:hypothetical protein
MKIKGSPDAATVARSELNMRFLKMFSGFCSLCAAPAPGEAILSAPVSVPFRPEGR